MNEKPIIFSTESVKAIHEDRKTMTRRVIVPQPEVVSSGAITCVNWKSIGCGSILGNAQEYLATQCPYGQVGGRLWVRETHYRYGHWIKNGLTKTGKQRWGFVSLIDSIRYYDNPPDVVQPNSFRDDAWYKRPSIFMPRWAARTILEKTEIRVERVQGINLSDIYSEGCPLEKASIFNDPLTGYELQAQATEWFANLLDSINIKRGYFWASNYWVWVISYKVKKNE